MRYIQYVWLALFLPSVSFGAIDLDVDKNGATDINRGGSNATTAAGARTNLGLGTASTPVFTGVNLGAASTTTGLFKLYGNTKAYPFEIHTLGADAPSVGWRWPSTIPSVTSLITVDTSGYWAYLDPATFATPTGSAASMTVTASGFDGNLTTSDNTLQEIAQKVDDLVLGSGGGYTNLTEFIGQTAWRIFYSDGSGDVKELALGSDGEYLKSNGAALAPSWSTPSGAAHDAVTLDTETSAIFSLSTQQITLDSQTANTFLGAPNGSVGDPTFRAIADADIPSAIARDTELPTDATISTSAVSTNDATTSKHGWLMMATAPAAGLRNILAIDNTETSYKNAALFDATSPSTQALSDSAAVGTAMTAARRDHKHAMPAPQTTVSGTSGGLSGTPNITVGTVSAGAAGFAVDADGDTTAKSFSATRTTSPQALELYEGTGGGSNKVTIAPSAALAADKSIVAETIMQSTDIDTSAELLAIVGDETGSASGTPLLVFNQSPRIDSIELGAASDTTIARSGAGAVTVEGVQVVLSGGNIGAGTATTASAGDNDTSVATTAFVQTAKKSGIQPVCAVIPAAVATDDYPFFKAPAALTITGGSIRVYQTGATNVIGGLDECTGTNGVCSGVTAVDSDITATDGVEVADDGTLTNGTIASGNWVRWRTQSVSGTNVALSVCFSYTLD